MSYIKISSDNYQANLALIAQRVGRDKMAVVLKDNAYGHGLVPIATLASRYGVTKAVVRSYDEAKQIAHLFELVLILADTFPSCATDENIAFAVNDMDQIKRVPFGQTVHLKVDTGMHRNGVPLGMVQQALENLVQCGLKLGGVFSHLRGADELSSAYFWQYQQFRKLRSDVIEFCLTMGLPQPFFHLHNSSGVFRTTREECFDFVRVGMATYGYVGLSSAFTQPSLKPVLSLWGERLAMRSLKEGDKIGYNGAFRAPSAMVVSTYDVGYGDGFFRLDGTKFCPTANGKPILGKVSMDNMIIASDEEEICIFEDARSIAKVVGTIDYEITTKLAPHIRREIV